MSTSTNKNEEFDKNAGPPAAKNARDPPINITQKERDANDALLQQGADAASGNGMPQLPKDLEENLKLFSSSFKKFWLNNEPVEQEDVIKTILDRYLKLHPEHRTAAVVPLDTLQKEKQQILKHFRQQTEDDKQAAQKLIDKLTEYGTSRGWPAYLKPPMDYFERFQKIMNSSGNSTQGGTGNSSQEGDNNSSQDGDGNNDSSREGNNNSSQEGNNSSSREGSSDSSEGGAHVPDDDDPSSLSKACGVSLPTDFEGTCIGYARSGFSYEALVEQGRFGRERYRLVPSKNVPGFITDGKKDLIATQRTKGSGGMQANKEKKDVKAWKAVAWRDGLQTLEDFPLQALHPTNKTGRFPVTRVHIEWQDGSQSWETRTSLRRLYPKSAADMMIYERARRAEIKYREAQGLEVVDIPQLSSADMAKLKSMMSTASRTASRTSTPYLSAGTTATPGSTGSPPPPPPRTAEEIDSMIEDLRRQRMKISGAAPASTDSGSQ